MRETPNTIIVGGKSSIANAAGDPPPLIPWIAATDRPNSVRAEISVMAGFGAADFRILSCRALNDLFSGESVAVASRRDTARRVNATPMNNVKARNV